MYEIKNMFIMKKINRLSLDESLKRLDVISSEEYRNLTGGDTGGNISINSTIKPPPTTKVSYTVKNNPTTAFKPGKISGCIGVSGTIKF